MTTPITVVTSQVENPLNDDNKQTDEFTFGLGTRTLNTSNYADSSFKAKIVGAGSTKSKPCLAKFHPEKPSSYDTSEDAVNVAKTKAQQTKAIALTTDLPLGSTKPSNLNVLSTTATAGKNTSKVDGYNKNTYATCYGSSVTVRRTRDAGLLPLIGNKCMVKENVQDETGGNKRKLRLDDYTRRDTIAAQAAQDIRAAQAVDGNTDLENTAEDELPIKRYYYQNTKTTGRIIYTCSKHFAGNIKYPLPTAKATNAKIGKGGNGFVFTMYHEKKEYAVKKTVYRSNEVNVHGALTHRNIIKLFAVMTGEKHERHADKFYCFHIMEKMNYDLRQVLSMKNVGSMKYFYKCSTTTHHQFNVGYKNVKYIFSETLEALTYLHQSGYVHRDIKASNIMMKMQCSCSPLACKCSFKFKVELGDFDSSGTVPGLGITEPTDQIIKFASILPLGTPGYRAPEVSMHITLSGPYETLYTTSVDMWSFGSLALNVCIGKTAALKQREEACLLLSKNNRISGETGEALWEKTSKIPELENTCPFSHDKAFTQLIKKCLNAAPEKRPSAPDAITSLKESMQSQLPPARPADHRNLDGQTQSFSRARPHIVVS